MPKGKGKPAARITDTVAHPLPPVLTRGPGSRNVLIGNLPAWRGIPATAVSALLSAKTTSDIAIKAAEAASRAASGTPAAPAAIAAEQATKASSAVTMSSTIAVAAATAAPSIADIHQCATPLPVPPHGPGVVISGSKTVLINGLPACRMGDRILEALGPLNVITKGHATVLIGD